MNKKEEKRREEYYADELALPPECDVLCPFRPCFNKYEDKGSFSVGRGYTSYSETFRPACGTRLNHGCPHWRGKPQDKDEVDLSEALKWAAEQLELPTRTKADRRRRTRAVHIVQMVRTYLELQKDTGISAGNWMRTSEHLPRTTPGEQAFILMWSPHWATWIHGMFTCWGEEKQAEWAMYNPEEDRFYEFPEVPEYWCEITTPEASA